MSPSPARRGRALATLSGAYGLSADPLDQRRLVVTVDLPVGPHALVAGRLALRVSVHAEGLARQSEGRGEVAFGSLSRSTLAYRFWFPHDEGGPVVVAVRQRLDRWNLRRLTELSGSIRVERTSGEVMVGPARLRLDWRGFWRRR